jgi:hypothetical protein
MARHVNRMEDHRELMRGFEGIPGGGRRRGNEEMCGWISWKMI